MQSYLSIGLVLAFQCGTMACKPLHSSELKHDFGVIKTKRDQPLDSCEVTNPDKSGYLKTLFDRITRQNPETFTGYLDPSKFCINLAINEVSNAFAFPKSGYLTFNSGLILAAQSDAEVAAVMAHELAHVTMNSTSVPLETKYPKLGKNPEFVLIKQQMSAVRDEIIHLSNNLHELYLEKEKAEQNFYDSLSASERSEIDILKTALESLLPSGPAAFSDEQTQQLVDIMHDKSLDEATRKQRARAVLSQSESDRALTQKKMESARSALDEAMDRIAANNAFGKTWQNALSGMNSYISQMDSQQKEVSDLQLKIDDLSTEILGEGVQFNWMEQEADEVGLELYIRAGFDEKHFKDFFERLLLSAGGTAAKDCNDTIVNFKPGSATPARGKKSHPSDCWRVFNTAKIELLAHAADYDKIIKQLEAQGETPIVNLPQSGLAALQRDLRAQSK